MLLRAFGVLGPTEALVSLTAFVSVLSWPRAGGRGDTSRMGTLLVAASGTAFAAIVLGQLANAFACRSETRPVVRDRLRGNPLLLWAVGVELVLLVVFLAVPPLADLLGGAWPTPLGWALALLAVPVLWVVDAVHKVGRARRGAASGRSATEED